MKKTVFNLSFILFLGLSVFASAQNSSNYTLSVVELISAENATKIKEQSLQFNSKLVVLGADLDTKTINCKTNVLSIEEVILHIRMLGYTAFYVKEGEIIFADENGNINATTESVNAFTNRFLAIYKNKL